jgi:c-di-GMP-binding flagellar brake protein YcgR
MTKKATKTNKAPEKKDAQIKNSEDVTIDRRREWRIDLPLNAIVEGELPQGKTFKEETILENISSTGAYFCLDSGITVGSKLNLIIEIPSELTEGDKVKLCLGGFTVRLEEATTGEKRQGVALRFTAKYEFIKNAEEKEI